MSVNETYDKICDQYAEQVKDELKDKPFERDMYLRLAGMLPGGARVADLGCGPGHITAHLNGLGLNVVGVDISEGMLWAARRMHPTLEFRQGDILDLNLPVESLDGAVAPYSLVHIPASTMGRAFVSVRRCMKRQGVLMVSFHLGSGSVRVRDWFGKKVDIDFHQFTQEQMTHWLLAAGFSIIETWQRPPYALIEAQSNKATIFARRV